ncbi:tetratricopeptide repeat protein [Pelobacter seleniigenes]|uniref:tetratricopeptide repeat protein n=1 Tax=Pelobacter seleniigenes TaxID=407188 RepID=UPI00068BFE41|nr:tetratricopeptide repeat protein [Pelobacter seleniigenes]
MPLEKFKELYALAEKGDSSAQYNLGVLFAKSDDGASRSRTAKQAIDWWKKAAAQGHSLAKYNLGHCYSSGDLVATNGKEAVRWFKLAAEDAMPQAQFALGLLYQQGRLVERDMEQALHWYLEASRQGFPQAIFNLADIYSQKGEYYDLAKAFKFFYIALAFGDENAAPRLKALGLEMTEEQIRQAQQEAQAVLASAKRDS